MKHYIKYFVQTINRVMEMDFKQDYLSNKLTHNKYDCRLMLTKEGAFCASESVLKNAHKARENMSCVMRMRRECSHEITRCSHEITHGAGKWLSESAHFYIPPNFRVEIK